MKKYLSIALLVLFSCRTTDEKSGPSSKTGNSTTADCAPMIRFISNQEEGRVSDDKELNFRLQRQFVFASGLPEPQNINNWKKNNTVTDAIKLYKIYLQKNASNKLINVFRQFGSYLILAKLGLLQEKNGSEEIYFFLNELADTKYEGACLIYNSLVALKDLHYDTNKINDCKQKFLGYLANYKAPADTLASITLNPKLPRQQRSILKRSLQVKLENAKFISLISAM